MSKQRLIVFLKAPRPGTVKTRVAQTAGPERACEIYRRLVVSVLDAVQSFTSVQLRFAPDDAAEEIKPWLRDGWTAQPQGPGDLGERMHRAFDSAFADNAERVVLIGSDTPEVRSSDVRSAWQELQAHDLVVGPATDGGYWLIGLRAPQPELFRGISWSSEQVLGQTLARAQSLGLRVQLLRILADVDIEADWDAYVQDRE